MKIDAITITLIGHAIYCGRSQTSKLLDRYSERNGTIAKLFIYLYKMNHKKAMSILVPFVHPKLHILVENSTSSTFTSFSSYSTKKEEVKRLSLLQASSTYEHGSGACGTSCKDKENFTPKKSKLAANFNQNFNADSLRSKRLNMHHREPKVIAKKSSYPNQLKKNANPKQEFISDNVVPETMDVQELFLNGKQLKLSHFPSGANYKLQDNILPDFTHISYREILEVTDNFKETHILGSGGFGTVYKGEWKGISIAIKRLRPKILDSRRQFVSIQQSLNEFNILKCCRFDHILQLYAVSLDGADPCLVYELMVNGSLEDWLICKNNTPPLTWLQRSYIAECTAKGLYYLHTAHKKPLVHGDIKSANILLDANMKAKIGDFGLTREGPDCGRTHVTVTSRNGTKWYLPEEYLRGRKLSPEVDVYSYGVVMLEIATGRRPYDGKTEKTLVELVKECDDSGHLYSLQDVKAGTENMMWFGKFIEIGQMCSSIEKKMRPPMHEVLAMFEKTKTEMLEKNSHCLFYATTAANSPVPLVISRITPGGESECSEILEESDSYVSSTDSNTSSESESSALNQNFIQRDPFFPVEVVEIKTRVPPIPLISELNMPVPEFDVDSEKLCNNKDVKS